MHTQYMAECHAIRAFLYFDVVRQFGNIPLLTKPTDENIPQADPADVYKLIFDDSSLPSKIFRQTLIPKLNRKQTMARLPNMLARAILARAYLYYTGYYGQEPEGVTKADALAAVEDIISSVNTL